MLLSYPLLRPKLRYLTPHTPSSEQCELHEPGRDIGPCFLAAQQTSKYTMQRNGSKRPQDARPSICEFQGTLYTSVLSLRRSGVRYKTQRQSTPERSRRNEKWMPTESHAAWYNTFKKKAELLCPAVILHAVGRPALHREKLKRCSVEPVKVVRPRRNTTGKVAAALDSGQAN